MGQTSYKISGFSEHPSAVCALINEDFECLRKGGDKVGPLNFSIIKLSGEKPKASSRNSMMTVSGKFWMYVCMWVGMYVGGYVC